jgi:hypothetical protein
MEQKLSFKGAFLGIFIAYASFFILSALFVMIEYLLFRQIEFGTLRTALVLLGYCLSWSGGVFVASYVSASCTEGPKITQGLIVGIFMMCFSIYSLSYPCYLEVAPNKLEIAYSFAVPICCLIASVMGAVNNIRNQEFSNITSDLD